MIIETTWTTGASSPTASAARVASRRGTCAASNARTCMETPVSAR